MVISIGILFMKRFILVFRLRDKFYGVRSIIGLMCLFGRTLWGGAFLFVHINLSSSSKFLVNHVLAA